jgi:flagellar biosynthesis/type III secretory pathway M-ring protein FliF/YscJ
MPTWLIWLIVIVVVVIVVAAVVSGAGKRRTSMRRGQAEGLRQHAAGQASELTESQRQAEERRAEADLARAEAERAEERAQAAQQGHQVEQATHEDTLREADRVDPDVDHQSEGYEPGAASDKPAHTTDQPRS